MKLALPGLVLAAGFLAGCASVPAAPPPVPVSSPSSAPVASLAPVAAIPASAPVTHPAAHPAAHSPRPGTGGCRVSLWRHIYHPGRLHVITSCRTLAGTVREVIREDDGDVHVWISPDPAYAGLARGGIHGWMTAEIICHGAVTQGDAVAACAGYASPLPVPAAGEHVRVTGSYVLDADHGWTEIHPVSRIAITGAPAPPPAPVAQAPPSRAAPAPAPTGHAASCYPETSGGNCYRAGEYCRKADLGTSGVAGNGERIRCEISGSRNRWEPA